MKDNGIGIPQEFLTGIFNTIKSKQSSGTANEPGTGLGLIVVSELVRILKGQIHVSSNPENGSTFLLLLPFV